MTQPFEGVEISTLAEDPPVVPAYAEPVAPMQTKARCHPSGCAYQALHTPGPSLDPRERW